MPPKASLEVQVSTILEFVRNNPDKNLHVIRSSTGVGRTRTHQILQDLVAQRKMVRCEVVGSRKVRSVVYRAL